MMTVTTPRSTQLTGRATGPEFPVSLPGHGLSFAVLLGKYPEADLTLQDISTGMPDIAAKRFHSPDHVRLIVSNYSQP